MKKITIVISVILLLFLDYAALDDITTGNEPNFLGEYLMLVVSVPTFFVLFKLWKKTQREKG